MQINKNTQLVTLNNGSKAYLITVMQVREIMFSLQRDNDRAFLSACLFAEKGDTIAHLLGTKWESPTWKILIEKGLMTELNGNAYMFDDIKNTINSMVKGHGANLSLQEPF